MSVQTSILKIKKRNGDIVDFSPKKISTAIEKAMLAVLGKSMPEKANELTIHVVTELENRYLKSEGIPQVEEVQDLVERALMKFELYDVARAYIIYRQRHAELRVEKQMEALEKIEVNALTVVKRDGRTEIFDETKLSSFFKKVGGNLITKEQIEEIVQQCKASSQEKISTRDISKLAVMASKSYIEKDPKYAVFTTKVFLAALKKEVIGRKYKIEDQEQAYKEAFEQNIKKGIKLKKLSPELQNFKIKKLAEAIDISRDELFTYRGLQTLYDRYFLYENEEGSETERRLETPQAFWMRVAMGLSINEKHKEDRAIEFYNILSTLRFVSSTPTLFHSGTRHPQLSSCYLNTVEDDLNHIFKVISDNAQLSKWSGGLGTDWSNVRATGARIKSTGVESQGVIPFLKISNDATVAINRSGKRRGAACVYLENWHLDVEDFLDLKRNTGDERRRTHDMNTALWIPDLFMKRVMADEWWTLFSPDEVPELHHLYGKRFEAKYTEYEEKTKRGEIRLYKRIRATELWKKMVTRLFETGHPWMTFKDPCNLRSPQDHAGVVHNSNLCTEITLNTSSEETAVCNLGSVNMAKHIIKGKLDEKLIKETVTTGMRMLDNVVDINFYPTKEAKNSNLKHRPVGLGIMGFQDALYLQDINFDSEEAVKFADESMEIISYHTIMASVELAKERGAYKSFKGSKWSRGILPLDTLDILERERGVKIDISRKAKMDWGKVRRAIKKYGMRNSNCMALAPTATISNISGCFPTIEPIYKNLYVKSNMSGEFTVDNEYLIADLKKLGLWSEQLLEELKAQDGSIMNISSIPQKLKAKYKEAFEINPEWLIKHAAYRGKWIDQSQSLNIFTKSVSGRVLSDIYMYAWQMGLKTTYYLRTMAASSIEKSTVSIDKAFTGSGRPATPVTTATITETVVSESVLINGKTKVALELDQTETEIKACRIDNPDCESCQ